MTTFDLDTLVNVDETNAGRLYRALSELGAHFREHQTPIEPSVDDIRAGGRLLLMTRAGPLDVLGFIGNQQRYEDLLGSSTEITMSTGRAQVLDLEALSGEKNAWAVPRTRQPPKCSNKSCVIVHSPIIRTNNYNKRGIW